MLDDKTKFIEEFKDTLLQLPYARYAGGEREIAFRCPYCGDSRKHADSTHFYVKVDGLHDDIPPLFNCKLCNISGILDSESLREIGVFDLKFITSTSRFVKYALSKSKNRRYVSDKKQQFIIPPIKELDEFSARKLNYLNERLGIDLSINDLNRFKILLNLYDGLDFNKVKKLTSSKKVTDILDEDFVGFISMNNEFANLRNMKYKENELDKRYYNYNIFGIFDNTKKMYTIPTKTDVMSVEPIELNISEGAFDILGVYFNVNNQYNENSIYCAACGSGYLNTIRYFIKKGVINVNVNIYSDSDKDIDFYKGIKRSLDQLIDNKITVYYNTNKNQKDFGVRSDQITLSRTKI